MSLIRSIFIYIVTVDLSYAGIWIKILKIQEIMPVMFKDFFFYMIILLPIN